MKLIIRMKKYIHNFNNGNIAIEVLAYYAL